MMKEPELEEEALWAEATGQTMRIIRQIAGGNHRSGHGDHPVGRESMTVELTETQPGAF